MSPDKPTIIFRDGWDRIGSKNPTEKERLEAERNIEESYRDLGIDLKLKKLTFIDI
ncbi:MAG: hypothetical protein IK021_02335 [Methanobrevibacter sp.]|nr:hypothetical protein [Methanobrevibacter sp.]